MGITLTREQFIKRYGQEGRNALQANTGQQEQPQAQQPQQHKPGFFSRAGSALKDRFGEIKKTFGEQARGDINPAETGVRVVGDVIAGAGDIIGAAISPQVEKIAQKEWAKPAFEALAGGMEKYESWKNSSELNRRTAEVLEGFVNIADLAGATGLAKITGKATIKVGKEVIEETAEQAGKLAVKTSEALEPALKIGKEVAEEIKPTRAGTINSQITKALDLTQGDISNIKLSTKNDVGEWISTKNLIGNNKKETLKNVSSYVDNQYKAVRDEIAKVTTIYSANAVPRVKESLRLLNGELTGILGQEKALREVKNLLKQKDYSLSEIQRVKEMLDKQFDLYKATGDVKAGQVKTGLANVRGELRSFLEKEVKDTTGADIRGLNNDVATGISISKQAEKRATRGFTRASVSLSDLGVFGSGSLIGTPLFGAAALVAKRVLESSTMRLQIAKLLKKLPKKEVELIKSQLLKGDVPAEIKAITKKTNPAVGKTVKKELEPLAQEAKKYKSAEEFVEAQPIVYHGSPEPLQKFEKRGAFFTEEYADATGFAGSPDNVYEGYLNLKKPLVVDAKGAKWDNIDSSFGKSTQEIISNAEKTKKYDGVVFKDVIDNIADDVEAGIPGTISYPFNANKSFINESQLTDIFNKVKKN